MASADCSTTALFVDDEIAAHAIPACIAVPAVSMQPLRQAIAFHYGPESSSRIAACQVRTAARLEGMDDPFTLETRLCDDAGMVSDTPVDPPRPINPGLTYLGLMNSWVERTRALRGDKHEPIAEPFACTGHAHLIGEHIRCTSPAHTKVVGEVVGKPLKGWQISIEA